MTERQSLGSPLKAKNVMVEYETKVGWRISVECITEYNSKKSDKPSYIFNPQ